MFKLNYFILLYPDRETGRFKRNCKFASSGVRVKDGRKRGENEGGGGEREGKKRQTGKKTAELLFLHLRLITTGLHIPDVT